MSTDTSWVTAQNSMTAVRHIIQDTYPTHVSLVCGVCGGSMRDIHTPELRWYRPCVSCLRAAFSWPKPAVITVSVAMPRNVEEALTEAEALKDVGSFLREWGA